MKRYWVVASSKRDYFHWADGMVVLGPSNLDESIELNSDGRVLVKVYGMDLNKDATSFLVSPNNLRPWHKHIPSHEYCYCLRGK